MAKKARTAEEADAADAAQWVTHTHEVLNNLAQIRSDACIDLTGYTRSIRELLMLFYGADLLITNDGGPGHFASLTPIRTMVFFGPETGRLYGPLGSRAKVLESGLACSPCLSAYNHRETFCDGDNQCLKRIAPDPVLAQALATLAEPVFEGL